MPGGNAAAAPARFAIACGEAGARPRGPVVVGERAAADLLRALAIHNQCQAPIHQVLLAEGFASARDILHAQAAQHAAISLVLGTLACIAVTRGNFRGREAIATFAVSPLMMPGLVVGVALLQFFREIGLRDAYLSLLLGHIVITLPFVMRTLLASMAAFDFSLIDAARTLGLSYPRAILQVLVPNLAPAYLTSGLFAFLASMDNYPISIFLTDARNKTLPIKMLQYLEEQPDPSLAAMSSGLILLAVIVLVFGARTVGLNRMIQG